jgi:hypothetical protein
MYAALLYTYVYNYLTLTRMAIKKKCVVVRLGVMYDFQATKRKQKGPPVRAPPCRIPIGHLGVIYDFQLAGIHKKTTTNRRKLLLLN